MAAEKENSPVNGKQEQHQHVRLNLAEMLQKTPFRSPEREETLSSLNLSLEEKELKKREEQMKAQLAELRAKAASTVKKTEKSAKNSAKLTHKLMGYDAKLESFEQKILALTEQTEHTKRELETTRQIINDTTFVTSPHTAANNTCVGFCSNSPKLLTAGTQYANLMLNGTKSMKAIHSARGWGKELISPLNRSFIPQYCPESARSERMADTRSFVRRQPDEPEESLEIKHFEMDSHFLPSSCTEAIPFQHSRCHIISQSPLLSHLEAGGHRRSHLVRGGDGTSVKAEGVGGDTMFINETYSQLRENDPLQSQETVKPRLSRLSVACRERSRMTHSSVSSFVFDNDIDEGCQRGGDFSPNKRLRMAKTPFMFRDQSSSQDVRRSKSLSSISEPISLSLASEDFANFQ